MKLVLMEKGLWGLVDGEERPPRETATQKEKTAHKARSDRAYVLISLGIERQLQIHTQMTTNPKEAWEILQKQFTFASVTQKVRLTSKFYAACMQEGDDLMEQLTGMSSIAQQLRELNEEMSPQKFTTTFLGSFPASYDNYELERQKCRTTRLGIRKRGSDGGKFEEEGEERPRTHRQGRSSFHNATKRR